MIFQFKGGFHRESGQSCRIYMDKCAVNIYGDWKLTSVSGFENLGADIGTVHPYCTQLLK